MRLLEKQRRNFISSREVGSSLGMKPAFKNVMEGARDGR